MKKIFYILASAIVALGAVACENEGLDNVNPENNVKGEGLTITAELTKVTWEGVTPSWESGDSFEIDGFTFTTADGSAFTCDDENVYSLVNTTKDITFGTFDSSKGVEGTVFTATGVEIKAEETTAAFAPATALLKYTTTENVKFEGSALSASFEAAGEGYIAVKAGEEVDFSYSIGDIKCKSLTKNFEPGKIYNLGTLTTESNWGVVGSFQGWDVANPVAMHYTSEEGWFVAKGVELFKDDSFKFAENKSWDNNIGFEQYTVAGLDAVTVVNLNGGGNIGAITNGKFDIYLNPTTLKFKYNCVEEYTDLMVDITIDNKANWSPLTITLKDGDTVIADKATVSGNKYAVSGNYIGKDLTCQFFSGSKQSEEMSVNISKNGATVTLEETIIKLKVQLNTANAKQWWGSTMKIHAWDTNTSFDTSWPGNTMTSEGNYTWSIIVPSELVGKTINFLVHNGNGWQSSDSKVTISAEGNTVTGSSIGIN